MSWMIPGPIIGSSLPRPTDSASLFQIRSRSFSLPWNLGLYQIRLVRRRLNNMGFHQSSWWSSAAASCCRESGEERSAEELLELRHRMQQASRDLQQLISCWAAELSSGHSASKSMNTGSWVTVQDEINCAIQ